MLMCYGVEQVDLDKGVIRIRRREGAPPWVFPGAALQIPFFFFTLVTGPRRSLDLKLSDTRVDGPQIRALIVTKTHFCVLVPKIRRHWSAWEPRALEGCGLNLQPWVPSCPQVGTDTIKVV